MDRTGIRKLMAQASKINLEGALSPHLGGPRASCSSAVSPPYTCDPQELVFLPSMWAHRRPSGWDGGGTRLD